MTMITNINFLQQKIAFITNIRAAFGIDLKDAKEIADKFNMNYIGTYSVSHSTIHNPIAYDLIKTDSYYTHKEPNQTEYNTLETKIKELTKEAIDLGEYSIAQSLINILK